MAELELIKFWAPWCGPCKTMKPVFEAAKEKVEGVKFIEINVDEDQQKAQDVGVRSIPAFVLLKDGKEVDRIQGAMPEAEFISKVEAMVKEHS